MTDGSKCSKCGDILIAQNVIIANGHTDEEPKDYICDVCDADLCTDHEEEIIAANAPTCTASGLTEGKQCAICGEIIVAQSEIPALGHSYEAVVTAPDCINAGYTTYTCSVCGDSYVADETEVLGHSYETVVTAPDCTNAGYTTYTCSVCGDSYIADETVALGHSYEAIVHKPTCEEGGYTTYVCIPCGHFYSDDIVEALGHEWLDATTEAPKTCENCGKTEGEKLPDSEPTPDDAPEADDTPDAEPSVDKEHSECAPKNDFERIIYMIINFFRTLIGLPEQCFCGEELK